MGVAEDSGSTLSAPPATIWILYNAQQRKIDIITEILLMRGHMAGISEATILLAWPGGLGWNAWEATINVSELIYHC